MDKNFKLCPFCGSKNIAARSEVISRSAGEGPCAALVKVWGECSYCGARGRTRTIEVINTRNEGDEILSAAVASWNYRFALI